MRRYSHLTQSDVFEALNKLRDAFLAAQDGNEVESLINALFTSEEKIKIGRRILVAECLRHDLTFEEITQTLKVGKATVVSIAKQLERYPEGFELIKKRSKKVENEYRAKKYIYIGGSQLIKKKHEYTGIKRKDIKR